MAFPPVTYTPKGKKLVNLLGTNATSDDLIENCTDKTDGFVWFPAQRVTMITASTAAALTRNAQSDYSWKRTATGAETHYAVVGITIPARTTASKGFKLTSVGMQYKIGVADATTVDAVLDKVTYADRSALVVASFGGVLAYDANHNTNAKRIAFAGGSNPHNMVLTLGTPAYQSTSLVTVNLEVAFVLANTNVLDIYGAFAIYTQNYL